jgi:hypothetical protein
MQPEQSRPGQIKTPLPVLQADGFYIGIPVMLRRHMTDIMQLILQLSCTVDNLYYVLIPIEGSA